MLLTGEIYGIISWHRLWGRLTVWFTLLLPGHKELHGTHTLDGHDQQRSRKRAAEIHRIRKTGPDPRGCDERLTTQNHDLEEQLRQRDAGHNVQEEN